MAGCRHHLVVSTRFPAESSTVDGCRAFVVSNPSAVPARLRLRYQGRGRDTAREEDAAAYTRVADVAGRSVAYRPLDGGVLTARQTAVVSALYVRFIVSPEDHSVDCPTAPFLESTEPVVRDEVVAPSVELLSDSPIVASEITVYVPDAEGSAGGADSLHHHLTPVHLWGREVTETGIYKAGAPATLPTVENPVPIFPGRTFAIAAFDDTHVLLPTLEGAPRAVTLRRGEVFSHTTKDALAGTVATADKPISLVSFTPMTTIDWNYQSSTLPGSDLHFGYNMALPSSLWGSTYVAARHGNRWPELAEAPAWRILGGADGTVLTYEPYRPDGAPEHIARGELAVFFADAPFVVRSQDDGHSFYMSESMTDSLYQLDRYGIYEGGPREAEWKGTEFVRGSAVTVHQLATSQWKKRYPFFASLAFPEHSLVLVRPRGGPDVRLDCAGTIGGWEAVGASFEYTRVQITGHLYESIAYPTGVCDAGAHWIESDGPFWGTQWGWGNGDTTAQLGRGSSPSYALPLVGFDEPTPPAGTK
jgi:hypothetical protein